MIPAGSFTMGSPETEEGRLEREGPQRDVRITRMFAMGRYTITRGQFAEFLSATGYDMSGGAILRIAEKAELLPGGWRKCGFEQTDSHPIVCVSWRDAQAYVRWLTKNTGQPYRLPTEAEWEYAARAGTETPFWTGFSISTEQANYNGNYTYGTGTAGLWRKGTVAVDDEKFQPNPFGLHHMHGNTWEWIQDTFHPKYEEYLVDEFAFVDDLYSTERVLRGGCWLDAPDLLRSSSRYLHILVNRANYISFRIARTLSS